MMLEELVHFDCAGKVNLFFLNCQQAKIHKTSNGTSKQIKFLHLLVNTLCKQQLQLVKSEMLVILIPLTHSAGNH